MALDGSVGVLYISCADRTDRRRAGDAAGALVILRGMAKAGVPPGEQSLASTMEAFASKGDVDRVLSLVKVGVGTNYNTKSFFLCFFGGDGLNASIVGIQLPTCLCLFHSCGPLVAEGPFAVVFSAHAPLLFFRGRRVDSGSNVAIVWHTHACFSMLEVGCGILWRQTPSSTRTLTTPLKTSWATAVQ